jgi:hypothetical protein
LVWQKELAYYNRLWDSSNDQIVYIVWLYTKSDDLLPEHRFDGHLTDVSCHHHGQGDGAVKHRRLCKTKKVGIRSEGPCRPLLESWLYCVTRSASIRSSSVTTTATTTTTTTTIIIINCNHITVII